ncbi:MAG: tetratricopeptide repeat protein, partial [Vulcanimicrobiaceae bacterium]
MRKIVFRFGRQHVGALLAAWLLVPVCAAAAPGATPAALGSRAAIAQALHRIAADDLPSAISGLQAYLASHPDEVRASRLLGDLEFRAGHLRKAESLYQAILAQYPDDSATHARLGALYAVENRVNAAITQYDASLPQSDAIGDLVALHERKGDLPAFAAGLRFHSHLHPHNVIALVQLGELDAALHHKRAAVLLFHRAVSLAPTYLPALNDLGTAEMDQHHYSRARSALTQCLALAPHAYACLDNLGALELQRGQLGSAQSTLTLAWSLRPDFPQALINLGYLADVRGRWHRAV